MESDEALYRDIRKGSKGAFELLYAKYERPLYAFILRRTGNREEAQEVFHEAMISIYRGPDTLLDSGSFAAWLYKVSLNLCLNRARSKKRKKVALAKVFPFESERLTVRGSEEDVIEGEAELLAKENEERVKDMVKDLSPSLQDVYRLRSEGKSYEEMSETLKVPVGTIKSRIHKMMSQMRKEVGKWIAK